MDSMKRDSILTVMLTKEEKDLLDAKYIESMAAGKCKNRSDFVRQALLAAYANGNSPASQDNKQEAPAPKSKLAMDFASIDI
jgi:Arc/MetJ-type ribon-helix-helix transcriptional regulator